MRHPPPTLLVVTDRTMLSAGCHLADVVGCAARAGAPAIWFRDRDLGAGHRRRLGRQVAGALAAWPATRLVVGVAGPDDVDLARDLGAWGVQVAAGWPSAVAAPRAGEDLAVGWSCHDDREVDRAVDHGADWVTVSPVFPTGPGHGAPIGLGTLARLARRDVPVLALGGVGIERVAACRRAGAAGVAVRGAVMAAPDPGAPVRALLTVLR